MGKIKYNYFALTVESMRWNPDVTFVIVNIVEDGKEQSRMAERIVRESGASNVILKVLFIHEWRQLVLSRLGVNIPFTSQWYYKLCDFKPTLPYLFHNLLISNNQYRYQYWGYADMDLIWGNFTRFAHLFQGRYDSITPHWHDVVGMAYFSKLDNTSMHLFFSDPLYVSLLQNQTYHNLDETGLFTPPGQTQYRHTSMNHFVKRKIQSSQQEQPYRMNHGIRPDDNIYMEMKVIYMRQDIPLVSWVRGNLHVVHHRLGFAPGRPLLFTHRMLNIPFPQLPPHRRQEVVQDMAEYGYLLPNWIPLLTRHMCRDHYVVGGGGGGVHQFYEYYPYNRTCFGV